MKINWQNINYFKITIWLLIILVVLIVVRFYFVNKQLTDYQEYHDQVVANANKPQLTSPQITPADPKLGQDNAQHTAVVFGSYTCEQCATVNQQLQDLVSKNPDKLKIVWKDFYDPKDPLAGKSAIAGRCAQVQGKFWEYHNGLMKSQATLADTVFINLANSLGFPDKQFSSCLLNQETKPLVESSVNEAKALELTGVPTVYLDGQVLNDLTTTSLQAKIK